MGWKFTSTIIFLGIVLTGAVPGQSPGSNLSPFSGVSDTVHLSMPVAASPPLLKENSTYHIQSLEVGQGLNSPYIQSLMQDSRGRIWMGNGQMGVSRYNGKQFNHFAQTEGITNEPVQCMLEDSAGGIWLGTDGDGLFYFDGRVVTHWTTENGLPDNDIRAIVVTTDGRVWVGTAEAGIVSFWDQRIGDRYTTANGLPGNRVRSLWVDRKGRIWIGMLEAGLALFDGKDFVHWTEDQGLHDNDIKCIYEDQKGLIWLGGYGKGLASFDGTIFTRFGPERGIPGNRITALTGDRKGNLWIGTYAGGACRMQGKQLTIFDEGNGLNNNHVNTLLEDRAGNIWMGTAGGGVNIFRPNSFRQFDLNTGEGKVKIKAIAEDSYGRIWLGTSNLGLVSMERERKSFRSYGTKDGLHGKRISALTFNAGYLWVASLDGGIDKVKVNEEGELLEVEAVNLDPGVAFPPVLTLSFGPSSHLWVGTKSAGTLLFEKQDGNLQSSPSELAGMTLMGHVYNDKTAYFGSAEGDLVLSSEGKYENLRKKTGGWPGFPIVCMVNGPEESVWIGTEGEGLIQWRGDSLLRKIGRKEGLNSSIVNSIQEDPDGNLWLGTSKGITQIIFQPSGPPAIVPFGRADGMRGNAPYRNSVCLDSRNLIWWGSSQGITVLDLDDWSVERKPPKVSLDRIAVRQQFIDFARLGNSEYRNALTFGKELHKASHSVAPFTNYPEKLVLPYRLNHLTFHFSAIYWAAPNQLLYAYRIQGLDEDWSPPNAENKAEYRNLPSGTHKFQVKAGTQGGNWGSPMTYTFVIRPPWWKTIWAGMAYLIAGMLIVVGIFKWRVNTLKNRQKELEQTVEERTAEVVAQNEVILKEKEHSDRILQNILPEQTAKELKQYGFVKSKTYPVVSVLFTDFKGFTLLAEKLTSEELVEEIHYCYKAFDMIMERFGVEKIKTIGDAYMAAGGLPKEDPDNPLKTVQAALAIRDFMRVYQERRKEEGREAFHIRIGIHTGPVVAGIVGIKKFAYDIWGDTVNTAARMESSGKVDKVNISGATYEFVKDHFKFEYRGKIAAKNKGELDMYFVERKD